MIVKSLHVVYAFFGAAWTSLDARNHYGDAAPHTPLYGIYNTRTFVIGKDTLAPIQTDTVPWKQLYIDGIALVFLRRHQDDE